MTVAEVAGLVLAAGGGTRLGVPKALVTDSRGTSWVARAVATLHIAGVAEIHVVVGAEATRARTMVPPQAQVVEAADWADGMGASLRAGLDAVSSGSTDAAAVVVMLVDTPGIGPDVVRRLLAHASPAALARATYSGRLGHPVLAGRTHWDGIRASARGDVGARDYLAAHDTELIECGDLADGADIDTPDALERWRRSSHLG